MNNRIISILYSLSTTFFLFMALACIFGIGSHLAGVESIGPVFKKMTSIHVWSCLESIVTNKVLFLWLLILVLIAIFLFFNTLFCTSQQLRHCFPNGLKGIKLSRIHTMAVIHVIALAVIACHALDITLVQRHKPVKILESEKAVLGSYQVEIKQITYQTDRKYIEEDESGKQKSSFKIPRKQFSIVGNRAHIAIYHDGNLLKNQEIGLFDPVRIKSTFFILDGFFMPYGSDDIGVSLHHSYNPLALPFFTIYTLLFSTLLFHCLKNRYRPEKDNTNFFQTTRR